MIDNSKFGPIKAGHNSPDILQGVQQNSGHFVFDDFLAFFGARIKILDIFQQPFPCRI